MNVDHLLKRRADVIARHEVLESVPGSGYHVDDEQAQNMARKGQKILSKRPVAMQHNGRTWLCGPDVPAIREALAAFVKKSSAEQAEHVAATKALDIEASTQPAQAVQAAQVSARVASEKSEVIELLSNEFNAILYGLKEMGIDVVPTGVLP